MATKQPYAWTPDIKYTAYGRKTGFSQGLLDVDIRGLPEVQKLLSKMEDKKATDKFLQQMTNAGGKVIKPYVQAAVPRRMYPRHDQFKEGRSKSWKQKAPGGQMERLRRSISSRQAARARPSTVISARPKVAFYRHWIERGTRPHQIRRPGEATQGLKGRNFPRSGPVPVKELGTISHPGVTHTTDYIGIGMARGEAAAMRTMSRMVDQYLAGLAK